MPTPETTAGPTPGPERARRHRERKQKAGLRQVQLWVPDTRAPGFAVECRRQSLMLRNDPQEAEVLDWIEAAADTGGWR
ncbi:MAG: antitoxin MazE family protein [Jannaschia sp.]